MEKSKTFQWSLGLVALILGLMLAMQFNAVKNIPSTVPVQRAQELTEKIQSMQEKRAKLQLEIKELRSQLDRAIARPQLNNMKEELDNVRLHAGVVALTGPGVEVTLNDSNQQLKQGQNPNLYVLHDEDISNVLNELKASGAEALAINGNRLIATSEVRCTGPTILVNKNIRLAPPFKITAIGDPETLESGLMMPGGVVDLLKSWGIQVAIKKMDKVMVPAYKGALPIEYAQSEVKIGVEAK